MPAVPACFVYSGFSHLRYSRNSVFNEIIRIGSEGIIEVAASFVPEIGFHILSDVIVFKGCSASKISVSGKTLYLQKSIRLLG